MWGSGEVLELDLGEVVPRQLKTDTVPPWQSQILVPPTIARPLPLSPVPLLHSHPFRNDLALPRLTRSALWLRCTKSVEECVLSQPSGVGRPRKVRPVIR